LLSGAFSDALDTLFRDEGIKVANPQKENGFTPIAHEIMEALASTKLTILENQALFLILRNTYGFQRKIWKVPKWKVFEDIGIHKSMIKNVLETLKERKIIVLDWENKEIGFLKNYEIWEGYKSRKLVKLLTKKVSHTTNFPDEKVSHTTNLKVSHTTNSSWSSYLLSQNATQPEPLQPLAPSDIEKKLKKDLKKDLKESSSSSSSSFKDLGTGDLEKNEEEDEFFLQKKKAEEILRKILVDKYDKCTFMDEDLKLIGHYEEGKIEKVAKTAMRRKVDVKMIPEYVLNGLINYDSLYKEKKIKEMGAPPGLLEHEKYKRDASDDVAAKNALQNMLSMLDEKEKQETTDEQTRITKRD
jgi:phage replication O-like protein O